MIIKEIKKLNPVYYDTLVLSGASSKAFVTLGAIQYAFDNYLFQNLTTYSNLNLIAALLYSDYVYIFLLAGMALLVAMLGSIVLTLNSSAKSKRQDYYLQTNHH